MKIVVIEAWGLHLGFLGCYGNDWAATPNLDRLAVEGIVFEWHFADQPELQPTGPWHERSVARGHYGFPGSEKVEAKPAKLPRVLRTEPLTDFANTVWAAMQENDDWLWIEGPSLLPPWKLNEELAKAYFDEEDDVEGLVPWKDPPLGRVQLTEAETLELQNTYASAVTYFDAQIGDILDRLRETEDDVLFCVTARSGLPLGEHGMIGTPDPLLHDELVHVPLLMRLPGGKDAGQRVAALTQPVDLMPTFWATAGAERAAGSPAEGQSLWPLIRGEKDALRPFAVSTLRIGERETWLVRTLDWALHLSKVGSEPEGPGALLFAKPEDRWEANNLHHQQTDRAVAMEQSLREFLEATGEFHG